MGVSWNSLKNPEKLGNDLEKQSTIPTPPKTFMLFFHFKFYDSMENIDVLHNLIYFKWIFIGLSGMVEKVQRKILISISSWKKFIFNIIFYSFSYTCLNVFLVQISMKINRIFIYLFFSMLGRFIWLPVEDFGKCFGAFLGDWQVIDLLIFCSFFNLGFLIWVLQILENPLRF